MKAMHKNRWTSLMVLVTLLGLLMAPALGQEEGRTAEEDIWTQVGVYGFFVGIEGDARLNRVTADVDASFNDIWDSLDATGFGFIEHRRGRWSFIGDVAYLKVEDDRTKASRAFSITLDAEVEQLMIEGFVGYRLLTQELKDAQLGLDLLGGARYNDLEVDLDARATLLGLTTSRSRNGNSDTVDGVVAVRVEYSHNNRWGLNGWADYGEGSDSRSYQFYGGVDYTFKNNITIHAGYRFMNFDYGGSRFDYDLDYSGPQIGVFYRF